MLGNGSIVLCRSSSQPRLGVKLGFTSEPVEVSRAVHFLLPCIFCERHSTPPLCALASTRRKFFGGIRIDKDMFEDNSGVGKGECGTNEIEDDEDDVSLVPRQWRLLQGDFNKSKSEKKLDERLQARKNQLRRAEELLLKREQLEDAGRALKERIRQRSQGRISMDLPLKKEDVASSSPTFNPLAPDGSGQALKGPIQKKFELDRFFSEDEIAWLKRGAPDLTKIDSKKWPPLQVLVAAGQFFFLEEYLKSELDLNAVDEDGYTPIHRAILGRKETAVSQLLRVGADPHVLDKDGATFLHYSAQTGSLNLVRLFVKYGVDINHSDQDGWTALHVAVLTARDDIARHLLLNGADRHLKDKDGRTPFDLCLAVGKGYRTFSVAKSLRKLRETGSSFNMELDFPEEPTSEEQYGAI
ncbi:hypothetical protein GOP47_0003226 [Adiantum capillus-veneris]|uniref:Uncharacterized protein n=1 Tax=Adiantum capillus-veneris TaxID=13818 RepID=A0A9D4ZPX7_ADICA|nr:hypothetical protein GOP47_0003226 [Adiantum capillus-veneris]